MRKEYQLTWKRYQHLTNRADEIQEINGVHFLDNTPLLSFSSFTSWIKRLQLAKINENVLDNAKNVGIQFMETLEDIFKNKKVVATYEFVSEQIKYMIYNFLMTLSDNGLRIVDVEKRITNGRWWGIVDIVCYRTDISTKNIVLLEIKTRSTNKCEILDRLQVITYAAILNMVPATTAVVIVNKKTFKTTIHWNNRTSKKKFQLYKIDKFLQFIGMEKYTLFTKKKETLCEEK